jgi:hypothetical protein
MQGNPTLSFSLEILVPQLKISMKNEYEQDILDIIFEGFTTVIEDFSSTILRLTFSLDDFACEDLWTGSKEY